MKMAPPKITKEALIQLIEKQRADSFWNHFLTAILWDYSFQGKDSGHKIMIWKQNFWNRTFYPVHRFIHTEDGGFIYSNSKLNPFGKVLQIILWFIPGVMVWTTLVQPFPFKAKVLYSAIILLFVFLILIVTRRFYRYELEYQLEDIHRLLGIEYNSRNAKKEWKFSEMLMRLFTYPLCIFLIALSLITAIPEEDYLYGTITLLVCFTYLIADLMILLRKSKQSG